MAEQVIQEARSITELKGIRLKEGTKDTYVIPAGANITGGGSAFVYTLGKYKLEMEPGSTLRNLTIDGGLSSRPIKMSSGCKVHECIFKNFKSAVEKKFTNVLEIQDIENVTVLKCSFNNIVPWSDKLHENPAADPQKVARAIFLDNSNKVTVEDCNFYGMKGLVDADYIYIRANKKVVTETPDADKSAPEGFLFENLSDVKIIHNTFDQKKMKSSVKIHAGGVLLQKNTFNVDDNVTVSAEGHVTAEMAEPTEYGPCIRINGADNVKLDTNTINCGKNYDKNVLEVTDSNNTEMMGNIINAQRATTSSTFEIARSTGFKFRNNTITYNPNNSDGYMMKLRGVTGAEIMDNNISFTEKNTQKAYIVQEAMTPAALTTPSDLINPITGDTKKKLMASKNNTIDNNTISNMNPDRVSIVRLKTGCSATVGLNGTQGNLLAFDDLLVENLTSKIDEATGDLLMGVGLAGKDERTLRITGWAQKAPSTPYQSILTSVWYKESEVTRNDLIESLLSVRGTAANDKLYGSRFTDYFVGDKGNDTLTGGFGDDIYVFKKGDGQDIINDYDYTKGNSDTLRLDDYNSNEVTMSRVGSDLVISAQNTEDQIKVYKYYAEENGNRNYYIEKIVFKDDKLQDLQTLASKLTQSMASFSPMEGAAALEDENLSEEKNTLLIASNPSVE